jgi:hypothetical protein
MTGRGNDAALEVDPPQPLTERITAGLIPKVRQDLQRLQSRTNLSKTDLVNRAITLYEFLDAQQRADHDVLLRNRKTGATLTVLFL